LHTLSAPVCFSTLDDAVNLNARTPMPRYMIEASYTPQGAQGLIKEGGSHRRAFVEGWIKSAGGRMETFDYAFGTNDLYAVCELPDVASAMALSLAVNAAGGVKLRLIPLVSIEDMDAAAKKQTGYRPPGQG
jgi:uncharacterized protein with GYD domain